MSGLHAVLAPSDAAAWVNCPGSIRMRGLVPPLPGEDEGREGTAAHWCASEALTRGVAPSEIIGESAPNGEIITAEMADHVGLYTTDVLTTEVTATKTHVEESVAIRSVHPTHCYGTPDAVKAGAIDDVAIVWDLKYGWGLVEVVRNWQFILYGLGVLERIEALGNGCPSWVEFRVVQPRPYHPLGKIRKWRISTAELKAYVPQLAAAAAEALGDNPRTVACIEACKHCSARYACPALNAAVWTSTERAHASEPMNLNGAQMGYQITELRAAKDLLEAKLSGLEEQALATRISGKPVPGWDVENSPGRQVWDKPVSEVLALGSMFGKDLAKNDAITPKQAIKKGVPKEVVAAYSRVTGGGLRLVKENTNKASEVFK